MSGTDSHISTTFQTSLHLPLAMRTTMPGLTIVLIYTQPPGNMQIRQGWETGAQVWELNKTFLSEETTVRWQWGRTEILFDCTRWAVSNSRAAIMFITWQSSTLLSHPSETNLAGVHRLTLTEPRNSICLLFIFIYLVPSPSQSMMFFVFNQIIFVHRWNHTAAMSPMQNICQEALFWKSNQMFHIYYY